MGNINQELERLQLISDFLKGKLSPKQLENFEKRLENEPVLQEELYKHKKLVELLKKKQEQNIAFLSEPKNDVDYMKQERVFRREQLRQELEKIKEQKIQQQENWEREIAQSNQPPIYKIATVFLCIMALGITIFVVATELNHEKQERNLQAEVTLLTSTEKENLLAFHPIQKYENDLKKATYSSIHLKAPPLFIENYTEKLVFEWNGTSQEEIYLKVIDSKNEIKNYKNLKSPFKLNQNFERGIYYWILQTDSEVIQRGKFLVK